jgi:tRNA(Ser,Leu) C12 N-acetylase TAN1
MTPVRHAAVERRLPDWNAVVTVQTGQFARALALLEGFGTVHRTRFYNVLVMHVENGRDLLEALRTRAEADPRALAPLMRVEPLTHTFDFASVEEFERCAGEAALDVAHEIAGHSFHVRMHRRGEKGRIDTHEEERRLGQLLIDEAARAGHPARLEFEDPDQLVVVETVGRRGGVSLWTREDRSRYPWLHAD